MSEIEKIWEEKILNMSDRQAKHVLSHLVGALIDLDSNNRLDHLMPIALKNAVDHALKYCFL